MEDGGVFVKVKVKENWKAGKCFYRRASFAKAMEPKGAEARGAVARR